MSKQEDSLETQFGYVAIVGRPNVGKSTLLNHLVGMKLSITSRKPQTTRNTILGVKTVDRAQIAYVDTPGLQFQQRKKIHQLMNKSVKATIREVDLIVFVVDGLTWNEADEKVLESLKGSEVPVLLVVNKVDRIKDKELLLPHLDKLSKQYSFDSFVPLSALRGSDVDLLENQIIKALPEGAFQFGEDDLTDRSERFLVGEIVREKIIRQLGEEIPYDVAVEVEQFKNKPNLIEIHVLILVEKSGQKKIIIGQQGKRIKKIGEESRKDIEALLEKKVLLKLWVKVKAGWADSDRALKSLGLE